MLNLSKKRVLVVLLVVMFLLAISTNVFAVDVNTNTDREEVESTSNLPTINQTGNVAEEPNTSVFTPTNTTTNNNVTNYNATSSLPKTGIDYSILIVIGLFVISAVYAYIKIRKYRA